MKFKKTDVTELTKLHDQDFLELLYLLVMIANLIPVSSAKAMQLLLD